MVDNQARFSHPGRIIAVVISLVVVLTLLAALSVGIFVGWSAAEHKSQRDMASHAENRAGPPNFIQEREGDGDGDGLVDFWVVLMRYGHCIPTLVVFTDGDGDSLPEEVSVAVGSPECELHLLDEDKDGAVDVHVFTLPDPMHAGAVYNYHDLDLNGTLDQFNHDLGGDSVEWWVLFRETWTPVIESSPKERERRDILSEDGSIVSLVFEAGVWTTERQVAEKSQE